MKNVFLNFLIGFVAITSSTMTIANDFAAPSIPLQPTANLYAKSGFFIGVNFGYGSLGIPSISYPSKLYDDARDNSDDSTFGELSVGYNFKVTPNALIGIELSTKVLDKFSDYSFNGYQSSWLFGRYEYSYKRRSKQNTIDLLLTTHYYLDRGLNIFAKIGVAYEEAENTKINYVFDDHYGNNGTYTAPTFSTTGIKPELSFGIGYTFFGHLDTHIAYTFIGGSNESNAILSYDQLKGAKIYSANMVLFGISYTF